MKCPKCGYMSFDHLDTCKKCGKGLSEEKIELNIPSYVPRIDSKNDFLAESEAGTPAEHEMMEAVDSTAEFTPSDMDKEINAEGVGVIMEDQAAGGVDELTIEEIEDEEDTIDFMDLSLEEVLEKPFSLEDDIDEGILEELESPPSQSNETDDIPTLAIDDEQEKSKSTDKELNISESVVDDELLKKLEGEVKAEGGMQAKDAEFFSEDSPEIEIIEIDEEEK